MYEVMTKPQVNADILIRSSESRLIDPNIEFQESYLALLREHQAKGRFLDSRHMDNNVLRINRDFATFVDSLVAANDPLRLKPGRIQERHFWLLVDSEIVARSTLRTELSEAPEFKNLGHIGYDVRPSAEGLGWGKRTLILTLEYAKKLGLKDVLLTCDSNNVASKRIIEVCGGKLECAVPIPGRNYGRLRYWISQ